MTYDIDYSSLYALTEISSEGNAIIVDLTKLSILEATPIPHIKAICSCSTQPIEGSNHCLKCGTSYADLKYGLNSYELYSIIYKFIEIQSKLFDCVSVISDNVLPLDFVGSLNKIKWTYLPNLPYRRNIIHISNDIVHTEDFFTTAGLSENVRDRVHYIAIFSSTKEVLDIHKSKIIHSSSMSAQEYVSFILGSAGFSHKYLLS